jgi:hypothetical protein
MSEIINKVEASGLISFDLESLFPKEIVRYDIKENLFQGLILKEKEFRMFLKEHNWETYSNKWVVIYCSEDVIIPTWAYMLLTIYLKKVTPYVIFDNGNDVNGLIFEKIFNEFDWEKFRHSKVVIKGCSNLSIPNSVYVSLTEKLVEVADSVMFGEPCSTVPLYKIKK